VNLHATLPLDEPPTIPAADDPVAQLLADAKLSSEAEVLDALEARRVQINLSNAELERLAGLTVGHATKCLGPARSRSPTLATVDRLLAATGMSWLFLIDPAKVARVQPLWKPRAASKVRVRELSAITLQRAKPAILAELLRKASRPKWRDMPAPMFLRALMQEDGP
jgi:transcriptional regulator with XRE-family HTH domain